MPDHALLRGPRLETPLRDLMTPGVVSLPDTATLTVVFEAMRAHRVHAVLVVSHLDGEPLGWVTSRALLERCAGELSLLSVRDAIDEPAVTLAPGATAAEAVARMLETGVGRIAVRHAHARLPEGIVSDLDLVALLVTHRR